MNPTTQKLVSSILTGFVAKWIRIAIIASGSTYAGVTSKDGTDATELATSIVSIVVPLVWSHLEDWVRSKQTNKALDAVAAGQTPTQAISETTTLSKTDVAKPAVP